MESEKGRRWLFRGPLLALTPYLSSDAKHAKAIADPVGQTREDRVSQWWRHATGLG